MTDFVGMPQDTRTNSVTPCVSRPRGLSLVAIVALLTADLLLISFDVLLRNGVLSDPRFSISHEGGLGESLQYGKAATAALLLFGIAFHRRSVVILVWALVFAFVLGDDAGQLHENAGVYLGATLMLPEIGGLRPNHLGELLFFGAIGCVSAAAFLAAIRRGSRDDRAFSRRLVTGFALLAVFGVALDGLHSYLRRTQLEEVLAVTEDGGEMIVLTLLLAHVCGYRAASARLGST